MANPILVLLLGLAGFTPGNAQTQSIADLPTFRIEQELRIDGHQATLVPIMWMGVGRDGIIAVLQDQDCGVRFFDSLGTDLGLVGRKGKGPGEFEMPGAAGWIADTLWVYDPMLKRVTLISTEPAVIRTLPPFAAVRPGPEDEARFPVAAMYVVHALYPDGKLLVNSRGGSGIEGDPLFQVSQEGVIERLVLEVPRDPEEYLRGRGGSLVRVPFHPRPKWTVAADGGRIGLLTTDMGTFRVSVFNAMGGRIFSRSYPFQGVPIPGHVADSVAAVFSSRGVEIRSRIPPIYPPVEKIVLGADGRTWVALHGWDEGEPWLILGADGSPLGRVVLPAGTTLHMADATHLWALERDEWDVESIVRYRIWEQD